MSGPAPRTLTCTRTLPYHPSTHHRAISDVSAYHTFLSQVHSSSVVAKDNHSLPKTVILKVGYPALAVEEEWKCTMQLDRSAGTAELKSSPGGVVQDWALKWKLQPPPSTTAKGAKTVTVELVVELKLSSVFYDTMFTMLPSSVPDNLMDAFEERTEELDQIERKERVALMKEKAKAAAVAKKAVAKEAKPVAKEGVKPGTAVKVPLANKAAPKKLEVRSKPAVA
ncbi:hypothetical protein LTR62_004643 [Meristemomyces frigidus]|uniref:Coenzyme Q-binding protein COQ10 START domain-containing protein n=1 Tax=Meristemomyces frigidus TaxID=1508187 RepID=A0AAN7TH13_9PEZI|nr:hypothetical protein LTR62_004643 [Meristemomyces frigidus]